MTQTPAQLRAAVNYRARQSEKVARMKAALERIACYGDKRANEWLDCTGNYGGFDEPFSVQIARQALAATDGRGEG